MWWGWVGAKMKKLGGGGQKLKNGGRNTFSNNGQKPPFSVILWPPEGRNLANVAKKLINSEHSPNKCTPNLNWIGEYIQIMVGKHHFDPLYVIFWPLEGQSGPMLPKSESFLNTHPTSVHHKFELDCVNTFSDSGQKPPFWPTLCHSLAPRGPMLPKSESFLNTHPTSVPTSH